jgi:hypothetical protein
MSGPQKYPGALLDEWYHNNYPGDKQEVNTIVLHTTEGPTLSNYSNGAVAPNFTAVPDFKNQKLVWHQHYDFDESSRALVHGSGQPATNTANVCQIELVGTCDPTTHNKWGNTQHIYWPEAPDWALKELAKFLAWANENHNIPLSGVPNWEAYPASYGTNNGVRMTLAQWSAFRGICGHEHVPENYHGDPGALNFAKLIQFAKLIVNPPTTPPPTKPPVPPTKPPTKPVYTPPAFPEGLAPGKSNPSAQSLQKALKATGWLAKNTTLSNNYGPKTQAAVAGFNKQHKLNNAGDNYDPAIGHQGWKLLFTLAYGS